MTNDDLHSLPGKRAQQIDREFHHLPVMTLERLLDNQEIDKDMSIIIALDQHT